MDSGMASAAQPVGWMLNLCFCVGCQEYGLVLFGQRSAWRRLADGYSATMLYLSGIAIEFERVLYLLATLCLVMLRLVKTLHVRGDSR